MTKRPYARIAALTAACLGLAVPAAVAAPSSSGPSGGSGLSSTTPTSTTGTTATTPAAQTAPVGGPISAAGNGFTLTTTAAGTYKRVIHFTGTVPGADSGDELAIQREVRSGVWQTSVETTVARGGDFAASWRANTSGLVAFRASVLGPADAAQAASVTPTHASPSVAVTIYRDAIATIYGPGFYGHETACGQTLTRSTLGVASRTLKCGTKVSIDYHGHSITVPVIDRGPYANDASWDLTEATAQALGDSETETVGAAVL